MIKKNINTFLIVLTLLLISTWLIGAENNYEFFGHHEIMSQGEYVNKRTLTDQPGLSVEVNIQSEPFSGMKRDDGAGSQEWMITDENAISDNVAIAGDYVAIGYTLNDERLELRNAGDGELIFSFEVASGGSYVDMSEDGGIIAYSARDSIWLFTPDSEGQPFFSFGVNGYNHGPVKVSTNGEYVVGCGVDRNDETNLVWCFRNANHDPEWVFEVPAGEAYSWYGVNIAGNDDIVIVNGKYRFYVLDITNGNVLYEAPTYNTESEIAVSNDGSVLVISSLTGVLLVYLQDDNGYNEIWRYRFRGANSSWVSTCAISADGSTIAAGTLDFYEDHYGGRLAIFDTFGNGEPLWIGDDLSDEVSNIALSRDGGIIAAVSWGDLEHQMPDLLVHEKFNSEPFYTLSTSGSINGVVLDDNADRIIIGGKGTHNRQFGRGGIVSMISLSLLGGTISGTVRDEDNHPIEGATIYIENNPYQTVTDENGSYGLRVEVDAERRVNVIAHKPGYLNGINQNINVISNRNTGNVNFVLSEADAPPENVRATQGERNRIFISWDRYNENRFNAPQRGFPSIKSAVGDEAIFTGLTPWLSETSPGRDDNDDAESINIYRSFLSGGPYTLSGTVDGDAALFIDEDNVLPQHRYYYVITADFGNGESAFSEEVVGWLDDDFLVWEVDLEASLETVEIDGNVQDNEWNGSVLRDISDIFGYDDPDSAGSVDVRIAFNDETDRLLLGFRYYTVNELTNGMGVGVYVDDDGSGGWTYDRPGSEGNYWGYWIDGAPDMKYRSLSGEPYNRDPYYEFDNPELEFSDDDGYVEIEMAIPLGFHGTEEIGLYHPDYTIGLGLFAMQRDQDENTIFNGWWPQNMFSIVSFPNQFAQIHIPAHLTVPPTAPTNVHLGRSDEDLVLTWSDPETGVNEGDLNVFDGIIIYRNGIEYAIVEPDVEEFADNDVISGGWYEYQLTGFVIENDEHFEGETADYVGMYAVEDPDVSLISYDDGVPEGQYVVAFTGEDNRFAVRYDLDDYNDTLAVYQIDFYTASAGEMEVYIAEDDAGLPGDIFGEVYLTESSQEGGFHSFHFPGVDQPVVLTEEPFRSCWTVLEYLPDSPDAPSIGLDNSNYDETRNVYYRAESGWNGFNAGQLMVRIAVGAPLNGNIIEDVTEFPAEFAVYQNFPNPFNGVSIIPVDISTQSEFSLQVYNLNGRLVLAHNYGIMSPGRRFIPLEVDLLSAGIYFVELNSGTEKKTIKVSLIK
ncbi:carboxypeptidase regulatory-like domain-containing protein [bacterium]|nr:carboxypeptidase regulatory-like domain-containing protein [bacterium]